MTHPPPPDEVASGGDGCCCCWAPLRLEVEEELVQILEMVFLRKPPPFCWASTASSAISTSAE